MVSIHFHNNHHPVFKKDFTKSSIKGKAVEQSVYYWWWIALRRSEKYKHACENAGAGMEKIYSDFGDVFKEPETHKGFHDWWYQKHTAFGDPNNNLGAYLFGEPPLTYSVQTLKPADLPDLYNGWDTKQQAVVCIPLQLPKSEILKQFKRALNAMPERMEGHAKKWSQQSQALYPVAPNYTWTASDNEKGPIWSIRRAFELYDAYHKDTSVKRWQLVAELDGVINARVARPKVRQKFNVFFWRRYKLAENCIKGAEQGIFPQGLRTHGL